jgi:hypothetical protein
LQENGSVILVNEKATLPKKKHTLITGGQFCIDGIYIENKNKPVAPRQKNQNQSVQDQKSILSSHSPVTYSGSEWHQGIIVCTPNSDDNETNPPVSNV